MITPWVGKPRSTQAGISDRLDIEQLAQTEWRAIGLWANPKLISGFGWASALHVGSGTLPTAFPAVATHRMSVPECFDVASQKFPFHYAHFTSSLSSISAFRLEQGNGVR